MSVEAQAAAVDTGAADVAVDSASDAGALDGTQAVAEVAALDDYSPEADPQLAAFFGEQPPERQKPAERGATPAAEPNQGEEADPAESNHQAAEESANSGGIDDETLQLAESYGYTPEEARALPNAESLRNTLTALDRRELARLKANTAASAEGKPEGQAPAKESPAPQPAESAADQATELLQKLTLEFDPDVIDEKSAATLNQLNEHFHGALTKLIQQQQAADAKRSELEQHVSMLLGAQQAAETQRLVNEADSFFQSLGDEHADSLGKGSGFDLKADSPQLAARRDIVNDALQLAEMDRSQGRRQLPLKGYLQRAVAIRNFDKTKELARKQVESEVAKRKESAVAKPSQRRTSALSPEARAVNRVRQIMRQSGATAGGPVHDELATWQ